MTLSGRGSKLRSLGFMALIMAVGSPIFYSCDESAIKVSMFNNKKPAAVSSNAPSASPAAGLYTSTQNVTLTSSESDAKIFYTLDGSTPTSSSTLYTNPISVSRSLTIKAISIKETSVASDVTSFDYTILSSTSIHAFADTTCFNGSNPSCITWTPKVLFDLDRSFDLQLFRDTSGTSINSSSTVPAGRSMLTATPVTNSATTTNVYAKGENTNYLNIGSFKTNYPANYSVPGIPGSAEGGRVWGALKDAASSGCTQVPNCMILFGEFSIPSSNGLAVNVVKMLPNGSLVSMGTGLDDNTTLNVSLGDEQKSSLAIDANGHVYAPGSWKISGSTWASGVLKWDGQSWSVLGSGFDSDVTTIAVDSTGQLYVSGGFICAFNSTPSSTIPRTCSGSGGTTVFNNFARWNGSAWTSMGDGNDIATEPFAHATRLQVSGDGHVYAMGGFQLAGNRGFARYRISDDTWVGAGNGLTYSGPSVFTIDRFGKVYLASLSTFVRYFDSMTKTGVSFSTSSKQISMTSTVNLYPGMRVPSTTSGISSTAQIVSIDSSTQMTISEFPTLNRTNASVTFRFPQAPLSVFDPATSQWSAPSIPSPGGTFFTDVYFDSNDHLYLTGDFVCMKGSSPSGPFTNRSCSGTGGTNVLNGIAKWNGSSWLSVGGGVDGYAGTMTPDGSGSIYVTGGFTQAGSELNSLNFAKWNGTNWQGFGQGMNGVVKALTKDNQGNIYVGGDFTVAGNLPVNHIAKWNGISWSALGSGFNGSVHAITLDTVSTGCSQITPCVYAAGPFSYAGNTPVNGIAKWDGSAWIPLGSGLSTSTWTYQLAFDAQKKFLYLAGSFSTVGGVPANSVAKWDGSTWSSLKGGVLRDQGSNVAHIRSMALDLNGNIYISGNFTVADGQPANNIAKWDGSNWSTLGPGLANEVDFIIADSSGHLFVGQQYPSNYGGIGLKKWNGSSWSDTTPAGGQGMTTFGPFAVDQNGGINVPIVFVDSNGSWQDMYMAKWNGTTWASAMPLTLSGGNMGVLFTAFDSAGNIFMAGDFVKVGDKVRPFFAKWLTQFSEAE